jgi:hypothetical protein
MSNNLYGQQPFRSFNTDVNTRRGGYRPGTIGVSNIQGKTMDMNRPGINPLQMGAGVSSMSARPFMSGTLQPQDYNIYARETGQNLYGNLYRKNRR